MIICSVKEIEKYTSLNKNFSQVAEYIESNNIEALPVGRTEVDGNEVFISIQEFE